MNIEHCVATSADLPQIADLGWHLRVDDELVSDRGAYERFIADFVRVCRTEWSPTEIIHWTAANGKKVLAVMSIALVRELTRARTTSGPVGCSPEVRNAGVESRLLMAIKDWASAENLELLVVWPSERAYPFYERAGFSRNPDPLVL